MKNFKEGVSGIPGTRPTILNRWFGFGEVTRTATPSRGGCGWRQWQLHFVGRVILGLRALGLARVSGRICITALDFQVGTSLGM